VFTAGDFLSAPNFAAEIGTAGDSVQRSLIQELIFAYLARSTIATAPLAYGRSHATSRRQHIRAPLRTSLQASGAGVWKYRISKGCEPPTISGELKMRTALFLSSVAAGVLAVSTMSFAQNYGAYAQAVGEAAQATTVTPGYGAPLGRYTRPDAGYRGSVTAPRNKTARPVAPAIDGPTPAQER
jgi:hypothetical protein